MCLLWLGRRVPRSPFAREHLTLGELCLKRGWRRFKVNLIKLVSALLKENEWILEVALNRHEKVH